MSIIANGIPGDGSFSTSTDTAGQRVRKLCAGLLRDGRSNNREIVEQYTLELQKLLRSVPVVLTTEDRTPLTSVDGDPLFHLN